MEIDTDLLFDQRRQPYRRQGIASQFEEASILSILAGIKIQRFPDNLLNVLK